MCYTTTAMPHKPTTRKEIKRLDAKQDRAAARQALDGGNARQPRHSSWYSPAEPVLLLDETPQRAKRSKKGCPKNKGGLHVPVSKRRTLGSAEWRHVYYDTVCKHCGKHRWGGGGKGWADPGPRPTHAPGSDHWDYSNIMLRLSGRFCKCAACVAYEIQFYQDLEKEYEA